jgi:hypothetical protein
MVAATTPTASLTFSYDADGIRWKKTVNGVATHLVADKNRDYAQVLEERDVAGALQRLYVYGDDLISQQGPEGDRFHHSDGQLSARQLTDASANVTDSYAFDAFGVTLAQTGSTPNTHLYTGEQLDLNLGFYYLRARYFIGAIVGVALALGFTLALTFYFWVRLGQPPGSQLTQAAKDAVSLAKTMQQILGGQAPNAIGAAGQRALQAIIGPGGLPQFPVRTVLNSTRIYDYFRQGIAYEVKNVKRLSLSDDIVKQIGDDFANLKTGRVLAVEWHVIGGTVDRDVR